MLATPRHARHTAYARTFRSCQLVRHARLPTNRRLPIRCVGRWVGGEQRGQGAPRGLGPPLCPAWHSTHRVLPPPIHHHLIALTTSCSSSACGSIGASILSPPALPPCLSSSPAEPRATSAQGLPDLKCREGGGNFHRSHTWHPGARTHLCTPTPPSSSSVHPGPRGSAAPPPRQVAQHAVQQPPGGAQRHGKDGQAPCWGGPTGHLARVPPPLGQLLELRGRRCCELGGHGGCGVGVARHQHKQGEEEGGGGGAPVEGQEERERGEGQAKACSGVRLCGVRLHLCMGTVVFVHEWVGGREG